MESTVIIEKYGYRDFSTSKFRRNLFCFLFYLIIMGIQGLCCFADDIKEGEDIKWFFRHQRDAARDKVVITNICFTNIDGSITTGGRSVFGAFHTTSHVLILGRTDYEIGIELLDVSERYATIRIIESGEITSTWTNTTFNSQKYNSRLYLFSVSTANLEATILYRRCNCYSNLIDSIKH